MNPASTKKKDPVHPRHLSLDERLNLLVEQAEADRFNVARLDARVDKFVEAVEKDREHNEGHRRNLSRALEDEFVASLPRVMEEAHDIVIKPKDIIPRKKLRAGKGGDRVKGEIDFIAPNGKLVLVGEVKTHLLLKDVDALFGVLDLVRGWFPKYKDLPFHGVVAGALIDKDAKDRALERGFVILRLDGAGAHPDTVRGKFQPTAY